MTIGYLDPWGKALLFGETQEEFCVLEYPA